MKGELKLIYLDYSATTPVDKKVLRYYNKISKKYIANPNSSHLLGKLANDYINKCSEEILLFFGDNQKEIIYTSGSSESNNLALKGIVSKYGKPGSHIITTSFEHPSVTAPLAVLQKQGYVVDVVKCDEFGRVDLNDFKKLINDKTILVSIVSVNSEIGILQPIEEIGQIIKKYPNCFFHSDFTQSIGKANFDSSNVDLISFSGHKFYGLKGIGALIKRKNIKLESLINGGKSTSIYRSGTPPLPLIGSLYKALSIINNKKEEKIKYVEGLKKQLLNGLNQTKSIVINSNQYCVPHIINLSIKKMKSKETVKRLASKKIYISSYTACSSNDNESLNVYSLTNNHELSTSCVRISLSHKTRKRHINKVIEELKRMVE